MNNASSRVIMTLSELKRITKNLENEYNQFVPSSFLEKINHSYKLNLLANLDTILNEPDNDSKEIANRLKKRLETNWELIKDSGLSYTCQPTDDVTLLLCEVAQFVSSTLHHPDNPLYPLNCLMPGVSTLRLDIEDFDEANQLVRENLAKVLTRHILSDSGRYLIPVSHLARLIDCDLGKRTNHYFDYETMDKSEALISEGEFKRLTAHSPDTQALAKNQELIHQLQEESPTLLAHLERLNRHLQFNSAHGGIGTQENAAAGAYQPIIEFFEFYKQLTDTQKEEIPAAVREEIDLLHAVSTDSKTNSNATNNLQTCIGTRRDKLSEKMKPFTAQLEGISVDERLRDESLTIAKNKLAQQKEQFENGLYSDGVDSFGFNLALLNKLNIRPEIESIADLKELMKLTYENLKELFTEERLIEQVQRQLNTLELVVVFLHDTEFEKKALIASCAGHVLETPEDLSALLMTFEDSQSLNEICIGLRDIMPDMEMTLEDYDELLKGLSQNQRTCFLEQFNSDLLQLVKTKTHLKKIIGYLSVEQQQNLIANFLRDRPIKTAKDLDDASSELTVEQYTYVFSQITVPISSLIENVEDMGIVFHFLPLNVREDVFNEIKGKLPLIVQSKEQLFNVMKLLHSEEQIEILEILKPCISKMSWTFDHICTLITVLSAPIHPKFSLDVLQQLNLTLEIKKRDEVCSLLRLPNDSLRKLLADPDILAQCRKKIIGVRDLVYCLNASEPDNKTLVISTFGHMMLQDPDNLVDLVRVCINTPGMIKEIFKNLSSISPKILTAENLKLLLSNVRTKEHQRVLIQEMPIGIDNVSDFLALFTVLYKDLDNFSLLYERFKFDLFKLVNNAKDLNKLLTYLSLEQRSEFLSHCEAKWSDLISSAEDFNLVLQYLTDKQRRKCFASMKSSIPTFIQTVQDFDWVTQYLSRSQRTTFFNEVKASLPTMIKRDWDVILVMRSLTQNERSELLDLLKNSMVDMKWSVDSVLELLKLLSPDDCAKVIELKRDDVVRWISSISLFKGYDPFLTHEQRLFLFRTHKSAFLNQIQAKDTNLVLDIVTRLIACSPQEQRKEVFVEVESFVSKALKEWLERDDDYVLEIMPSFLAALTPKQCTHLLSTLSPSQLTALFAPFPLGKLVKLLSHQQRMAFLQRLKEVLPQCIRTGAEFNHVTCLLNPVEQTFVFDTMKPLIPGLITTVYDFTNVMEVLTVEQCSELFNAVDQKLPKILLEEMSSKERKPSDLFCDLMKYLSPGESSRFIISIAKVLLQIIPNADEFDRVVQKLSPQQQTLLVNAMTFAFPDMLQGKIELFCKAIHSLHTLDETPILEMYWENLAKMIGEDSRGKAIYYFSEIARLLSTEQITNLFESVKHRLIPQIENDEQMYLLLQHLSPEQRNGVVDDFFRNQNVNLDDFILYQRGYLGQLMGLLTPDRRSHLFEKLLPMADLLFFTLDGLYGKNTDRLCRTMEFLTLEQRNRLFNEIKEAIPGLIHIALDVHYIMEFISPEQREYVFNIMEIHLPQMIKSASDFFDLMYYLTPEQHCKILSKIDPLTCITISSADDFCMVMKFLNQESRRQLFDQFEFQLPEMVKNSGDFVNVMTFLTPEQRNTVFIRIQERIPFLLHPRFEEYFKWMEDTREILSPEQHQRVLNEIKTAFTQQILTVSDFNLILSPLSPERRTALFELIQPHLLGIILNPKDLIHAMKYLTPVQREELSRATKIALVQITEGLAQNNANLAEVIHSLRLASPDVKAFVFEQTKAHIIKCIDSAEDFAELLEQLSPDQRTVIFEAKKNELYDFIVAGSGFDAVAKHLNSEQQLELYTMFKQRLPENKASRILSYVVLQSKQPLGAGVAGLDKDLELIALLEESQPTQWKSILKELNTYWTDSKTTNFLSRLEGVLQERGEDLNARIEQIYSRQGDASAKPGFFAVEKPKLFADLIASAKQNIEGDGMMTLIQLLTLTKPNENTPTIIASA